MEYNQGVKYLCMFLLLIGFSSNADYAPHLSLEKRETEDLSLELSFHCVIYFLFRYEAKTTVIRKGHQPEGCYFVVTGKLTAKSNDASSIVQNSITEVLNEIEEGDLFGVRLFALTNFCDFILVKTKIFLDISRIKGCRLISIKWD